MILWIWHLYTILQSAKIVIPILIEMTTLSNKIVQKMNDECLIIM